MSGSKSEAPASHGSEDVIDITADVSDSTNNAKLSLTMLLDPLSPTIACNNRPPSAEAFCPICLGKYKNKSFTDSCFHEFCFVCLVEWSKVKAECPLCKQKFRSIIHNVRSLDDYDQYHLTSTSQGALQIYDRRNFRYRTTFSFSQRFDPLSERRRYEHRGRAVSGNATTTSAFRRRVYAQGLKVVDQLKSSGQPVRRRIVSPEMFRQNPTHLHRLVPWLNRELNVLLHNHDDHVQFVLELILDLVKMFDIRSEEFAQRLRPLIGLGRTNHFVEEFYSFAESPYDMVGYDKHVSYGMRLDDDFDDGNGDDDLLRIHHDISSTLDDNDDEDEDDDIIVMDNIELGLPTIARPSTLTFDRSIGSSSSRRRRHLDRMSSRAQAPSALDYIRLSGATSNHSSNPATDKRHSTITSYNKCKKEEADVKKTSSVTKPQLSARTLFIDSDESDDNVAGPSRIDLSHRLYSKVNHSSNKPGVKPSQSLDKGSDTEDEVVCIGYQKPYRERSPICLSSDEEITESGNSRRTNASSRCEMQAEREVHKDSATKYRKHTGQGKSSRKSKRQEHAASEDDNVSKPISHSKGSVINSEGCSNGGLVDESLSQQSTLQHLSEIIADAHLELNTDERSVYLNVGTASDKKKNENVIGRKRHKHKHHSKKRRTEKQDNSPRCSKHRLTNNETDHSDNLECKSTEESRKMSEIYQAAIDDNMKKERHTCKKKPKKKLNEKDCNKCNCFLSAEGDCNGHKHRKHHHKHKSARHNQRNHHHNHHHKCHHHSNTDDLINYNTLIEVTSNRDKDDCSAQIDNPIERHSTVLSDSSSESSVVVINPEISLQNGSKHAECFDIDECAEFPRNHSSISKGEFAEMSTRRQNVFKRNSDDKERDKHKHKKSKY